MEQRLAEYRGLIYKTALLYLDRVDGDLDDLVQELSIKVWRVLLAYDAQHPSGKDERRFVFMCLVNKTVDWKRYPNRTARATDYIEDLAAAETPEVGSGFQSRDSFEIQHGLTSSHDSVYGDVDEGDLLLPNTLTGDEREMIELLLTGLQQIEAGQAIGLDKRGVERIMRRIRLKLADWRPSGAPPAVTTLPTARAAELRAAAGRDCSQDQRVA